MKEETDAIVNPTDQFLVFNKGVGAQLIEKGGQSIQLQADQIIEESVYVPTGFVTVTDAGNLNT